MMPFCNLFMGWPSYENSIHFDTYFAINIDLFGPRKHWNVTACQKILQLETTNQYTIFHNSKQNKMVGKLELTYCDSVFTAWSYAECNYGTVCCLSIHMYVTFRYHDHIGWNNFTADPNMGNMVQRQLAENYGGIGVGSSVQKPAILKQCKIGPRLLWWTNS